MTEPGRLLRRDVTAALRQGTVPRKGLDLFAVGTDRFAEVLDELRTQHPLPEQRVEQGLGQAGLFERQRLGPDQPHGDGEAVERDRGGDAQTMLVADADGELGAAAAAELGPALGRRQRAQGVREVVR